MHLLHDHVHGVDQDELSELHGFCRVPGKLEFSCRKEIKQCSVDKFNFFFFCLSMQAGKQLKTVAVVMKQCDALDSWFVGFFGGRAGFQFCRVFSCSPSVLIFKNVFLKGGLLASVLLACSVEPKL